MQINHRRCGHIIETQIAPCASLIYFLLIWLYFSKIGYTMYQHHSLPITYILGVVLVFSIFSLLSLFVYRRGNKSKAFHYLKERNTGIFGNNVRFHDCETATFNSDFFCPTYVNNNSNFHHKTYMFYCVDNIARKLKTNVSPFR